MKHRQHAVAAGEHLRREQRIGRQGALQLHALLAQPVQHRGNDLDLFAPEVAALARVRIQAGDENARRRHAETLHERAVQNAQGGLQAVARDGARDLGQREVRRGQGHAQTAADEHHDHARRGGQPGEILGMPGKRNAGIVDRALVHRRGHHRGEAPVQAAGHGAIEQSQHVGTIRGVQRARGHGRGEGQVQHFQLFFRGRAGRVEFAQAHRQAELRRAHGEQIAIGEDDGAAAEAAQATQTTIGPRQADVRADSGRLAGGDCDDGESAHRASRIAPGGLRITAPPAGTPRRRGRAAGAATPGTPRRPCARAGSVAPACACARPRRRPCAAPAPASDASRSSS